MLSERIDEGVQDFERFPVVDQCEDESKNNQNHADDFNGPHIQYHFSDEPGIGEPCHVTL